MNKNLRAFLTKTQELIPRETGSITYRAPDHQPSSRHLSKETTLASRNPSITHRLQSDHSLVKLRKQELEQERQDKILARLQHKETKIDFLKEKKIMQERYRKEPTTIFEKSMRLKERVEERRRVFNTKSTPYITNKNEKSLTPSRSRILSKKSYINRQED